jgi:hypothetical protein
MEVSALLPGEYELRWNEKTSEMQVVRAGPLSLQQGAAVP